MGQQKVTLSGGRRLVVGYDAPFKTFFAQLWDPAYGFGAPAKAAGYHPAERGIPPIAGEYGPYPMGWEELEQVFKEWGLGTAERDMAGTALARESSPNGTTILGVNVEGIE